jgi:hypothetical protein
MVMSPINSSEVDYKASIFAMLQHCEDQHCVDQHCEAHHCEAQHYEDWRRWHGDKIAVMKLVDELP